jgi:peroxiredoxin
MKNHILSQWQIVFFATLSFFLLNGNLFAQIQANTVAPEIALEAIYNKKDDQIPTLASLKGKIVILDFWATWCSPCLKAFPKHNKLYKKYQDSGVEFIAITDDPKEQLEDFLAKMKLDFWIARDDDQTEFTNYKIVPRPQIYIINREGIVVYQGKEITEEMLKEVIKTNTISATFNSSKPSQIREKERLTQEEAEKQGREIVEKYQTAIGSKNKEEKVKTFETVTEIETMAGKRKETKIEDRTDKNNIKTYTVSEGGIEGKREVGFDGKRTWMKNNSFRGYRGDGGLNLTTSRMREPIRYVKLPNEKIGGKEYLVVKEFFDRSTTQIKSYFHPETFLLFKRKMSVELNGNRLENNITYSDYRDVGGFLIPFVEEMTNGSQTIKKRLLSVKYNAEVNAKIFEFDSKN